MALAITGYNFGFVEASKATTQLDNVQFMSLPITSANSDLTWDISDVAGTFWTAVAAANANGAAALAFFKQVKANIDRIWLTSSDFKFNRIKIAVNATAADYTEALTAGRAATDFTFFAANAPVSDTVTIVWKMKPGTVGVTANS